MPVHGVEPWVCFPLILMVNQSEEAIIDPLLYFILPISRSDEIWSPKTASTFGLSMTPSLIINGAPPSSSPGGPSSAGWKKNLTVPEISFFMPANTSAVPIRMEVCVSWPQACITETGVPI